MWRLLVVLMLAPLASVVIVVLGVATLTLVSRLSPGALDWMLRRVFGLAAWAGGG